MKFGRSLATVLYRKRKANNAPLFYFSVIKSQLAFTFPVATIKLITVRVKDIYPSIATN